LTNSPSVLHWLLALNAQLVEKADRRWLLLVYPRGRRSGFSDLYIYYTFDNTHGYLLTVELATSGK
jgi:hypothetical protein